MNRRFITLEQLKSVTSALLAKINQKPDSNSLSDVSFTGDYNDLSNKPDFSNFVNQTALQNSYTSAMQQVEANCMVIGRDYVTAGQKSGETLGQYATAEGYQTISSGQSSHTEGLFSTASHDASHAEGSETTASGLYSHAEGNSTIASGYSSHSEGNHTFANDIDTHAEGNNTVASGQMSHVEGQKTITIGHKSHAEGYSTIAIGEESHAEGIGFTIDEQASTPTNFKISGSTDGQVYTYPSTYSSILEEDFLRCIIKIFIDNVAICKRITSVNTTNLEITLESSINNNSTILNSAPCYLLPGNSIGIASHAEGNVTTARGNYSHSEGSSTTANGESSHAEGDSAIARGNYSHSEGSSTTASGQSSHAEGYVTTASGQNSHSEGSGTTASGQNSHAEGNGAIASGESSHAEGNSTTASGNYSHAEGILTVASGESSHAEGQQTTAQRRSQHTFGEYNILDTTGTTTTKGQYIEIVGNGTISARSNARTLDWSGNETLAGKLTVGAGPTESMDVATKQYVDNYTPDMSAYMQKGVDYVTAGQKNGTTLGFRATAEGNNTSAIGYYSHAEGDNTSATGHYSHAEGSSTTASGNAAHAEGSSTTASGESAHAEGSGTTASGESAHAEGSGTSAGGTYAHAEGYFTNARRKSQHVFGEYNVLDTTGTTGTQRGAYIEIVGKGTADNARSNARTLDWSGNEVLAGKLTVGAAPTANMDVATKQYVDATRTVAQGGTGATSFTANCVIMSGSSTTAALTTRAVTNNTATSGAVSANTNIPTMNTLRFAINRTTSVAAADTGYTTYMARGEALNSADTNPTVNGAISWTYA